MNLWISLCGTYAALAALICKSLIYKGGGTYAALAALHCGTSAALAAHTRKSLILKGGTSCGTCGTSVRHFGGTVLYKYNGAGAPIFNFHGRQQGAPIEMGDES